MTHGWAASVRALFDEYLFVLRLDRCRLCGGLLRRNQTWVISEWGYRHDVCPDG